MPQRCINPGCFGDTYRSVFRVPKNIDMRAKWLKAVREVYPNLNVGKNFNVCEKHFLKTDITSYIADKSGKIVQMTVQRKRLKHGAVPHFGMLILDSGNDSMKTVSMEQDEPIASTNIDFLKPRCMIDAGSSVSMSLKAESASNVPYRWMDLDIHDEGAEMLTAVVKVERDATYDQCESAITISCKKEAEYAEMLTTVLINEQCESATAITCKEEAEGAEMVSAVVKVEHDVTDDQCKSATAISCKEKLESAQMLTAVVKVERNATDDQCESATAIFCKEEASYWSYVQKDFQMAQETVPGMRLQTGTTTTDQDQNDDVSMKRKVGLDDTLIKEEMEIGPTEIQPTSIPHSQLETAKTDTSTQQLCSLNTRSVSTELHNDLLVEMTSSGPRTEGQGLAKSSYISDVGHDFSYKRSSRLQQSSKHEQHMYNVTILPSTSRTNTNRKTNKQMAKCGHCDYRTSDRGTLHNHERIHTGERPYKCEYCGYSASDHGNLQNHILTHTGERPYKCEYCDYSASDRSSLQNHICTNTGERPYQCDYCGYSTCDPGTLQTHIMRRHTGKRSYICDYCDYTTSQSIYLERHMRIHNKERPYKCDYCNFSAPQRGSVHNHMRIHMGERKYKCDYCDYTAYRHVILQSHITRIHTGERPYKCEHCDYSTSVRSNLQIHIRIHMGQKLYKCEYCGYSASERGSLQKHIAGEVPIPPN